MTQESLKLKKKYVSRKKREIKLKLEKTANKIQAKMSDIEYADELIYHIDNPCLAEIKPGETNNIRSFHLRLAEEALPTLKNPFARELLEKKIAEYQHKEK